MFKKSIKKHTPIFEFKNSYPDLWWFKDKSDEKSYILFGIVTPISEKHKSAGISVYFLWFAISFTTLKLSDKLYNLFKDSHKNTKDESNFEYVEGRGKNGEKVVKKVDVNKLKDSMKYAMTVHNEKKLGD